MQRDYLYPVGRRPQQPQGMAGERCHRRAGEGDAACARHPRPSPSAARGGGRRRIHPRAPADPPAARYNGGGSLTQEPAAHGHDRPVPHHRLRPRGAGGPQRIRRQPCAVDPRPGMAGAGGVRHVRRAREAGTALPRRDRGQRAAGTDGGACRAVAALRRGPDGRAAAAGASAGALPCRHLALDRLDDADPRAGAAAARRRRGAGGGAAHPREGVAEPAHPGTRRRHAGARRHAGRRRRRSLPPPARQAAVAGRGNDAHGARARGGGRPDDAPL